MRLRLSLNFWILVFCFCYAANAQNKPGSAQPLRDKAASLAEAEKYDSAIYFTTKAYDIHKSEGKRKEQADCAIDIAIYLLYKEDYSNSLKQLTTAYGIIVNHLPEEHLLLAGYHNLAGVVQYQLGNYEEAIANLKESLTINLRLKNVDSLDIAVKHNNLGMILTKIGDYDEAILHFNKSLAIRKTQPENPLSIAESYNNLSECYYRKKQFRESLHYSEFNLNILNDQKNTDLTKRYILCYNSMAIAYLELKEYAAARQYLKKALLLNQTTDYAIEKTYHNLGYVHRMSGNDEQALYYLALAIQKNTEKFGSNHPDIGKEYRHVGFIHAGKGETEKALEYYQKALHVLSHDFNDSTVLTNPTSFTGVNSKPDLLRALRDKSLALREWSKKQEKDKQDIYLKASLETAILAVHLIDSMRSEYELKESKQFIAEEALPVYEIALKNAHLLSSNPHYTNYCLQEAFQILEKSRALLLLEDIQQNNSKHIFGVPDSLLQQEKKLIQSISFYEKKLSDAYHSNDSMAINYNKLYMSYRKSEYNTLIESYKNHYPAYYNKKQPSIISLHEVRKNVTDHETAFISFFTGSEKIYIFCITANNSYFFAKEKPVHLDRWIANYRKSLSDYRFIIDSAQYAFTQYSTSAHNLFNLLLHDAVNSMPSGISRLVIAPDGALGHIPFESLLTNNVARKTSYAHLPYLIRRYAVSYAYSASLQYELKLKRNFSNKLCLAFAPGFMNQNLPENTSGTLSYLRDADNPLPGTLQEIKDIASFFDGKFYIGSEANETNFKKEAGPYALIHLATHGVSDNEFPLRSNLKFSKENTGHSEDGILYAYEISNLTLQADLVVLSACESGYGKLTKGEGIMSLGRNFIHAGSRSVIISLWKIEDKASQQLLTLFYKHFAYGHDKDYSIQQAKLDYLSTADNFTAHPAFWAGIVLIGNNTPAPEKNTIVFYIIAGIASLFIAFFLIRIVVRTAARHRK